MQKLRIGCIINPRSGVRQIKNLQEELTLLLDSEKFSISFFTTERRNHATELAHKIVLEKYDILLICGGDGTINEAIQCAVNQDIVVGIIPTGSGNGLSMHTGIGRDHKEAADIINRMNIRKIDCISYNKKYLVNLAGIGFDGFLTEIIATKSYRGFWLYIWLFLRYFWSYKTSEYSIVTDTETATGRYNMIEVANGPMYGYNFEVVPGADISDGIIDVLLLEKTSVFRILLDSLKLLRNDWENISWAKRLKSTAVKITSNSEIKMHVDGEFTKLDSNEINFKILPESINLIVP